MGRDKKYSSFKEQQKLTENFRRFINEGYNMGPGNPDYAGGDSRERPGGWGSDESKTTAIEDSISDMIAYYRSVKGKHEWDKIHPHFRSAASATDFHDRLIPIRNLKKLWGAGANFEDWKQGDFQAVLDQMGDKKPVVRPHGEFNKY